MKKRAGEGTREREREHVIVMEIMSDCVRVSVSAGVSVILIQIYKYKFAPPKGAEGQMQKCKNTALTLWPDTDQSVYLTLELAPLSIYLSPSPVQMAYSNIETSQMGERAEQMRVRER